jgi:hypothetical protein
VARPDPGIPRKVVTAGLTAAAGVIARSLAKRALRPVEER